MICKRCGTLFDPNVGPCPKCNAETAEKCSPPPKEMSQEELINARRRSWIELLIGIPLLIGMIYLIIWLIGILKG